MRLAARRQQVQSIYIQGLGNSACAGKLGIGS